MFRVPTDPMFPTFDHTYKVSFFKWLTSKASERHEWRRRRDTAAEVARVNQNKRARDFALMKANNALQRTEAGLARRVADGKETPEGAQRILTDMRAAIARM